MEIHRTVHAYLEWISTCQLNFWCLLIFEKKKVCLICFFPPAGVNQQVMCTSTPRSSGRFATKSCRSIVRRLNRARISGRMWVQCALIFEDICQLPTLLAIWFKTCLLGQKEVWLQCRWGERWVTQICEIHMCFGVLDSCRVEKRTVWIEIVGVQMLTRAALPSGYGPASLKIVARITTCTKKVEIMWNEGMM